MNQNNTLALLDKLSHLRIDFQQNALFNVEWQQNIVHLRYGVVKVWSVIKKWYRLVCVCE